MEQLILASYPCPCSLTTKPPTHSISSRAVFTSPHPTQINPINQSIHPTTTHITHIHYSHTRRYTLSNTTYHLPPTIAFLYLSLARTPAPPPPATQPPQLPQPRVFHHPTLSAFHLIHLLTYLFLDPSSSPPCSSTPSSTSKSQRKCHSALRPQHFPFLSSRIPTAVAPPARSPDPHSRRLDRHPLLTTADILTLPTDIHPPRRVLPSSTPRPHQSTPRIRDPFKASSPRLSSITNATPISHRPTSYTHSLAPPMDSDYPYRSRPTTSYVNQELADAIIDVVHVTRNGSSQPVSASNSHLGLAAVADGTRRSPSPRMPGAFDSTPAMSISPPSDPFQDDHELGRSEAGGRVDRDRAKFKG